MDLVPRPTRAEYTRRPGMMVMWTAPARDAHGPYVYGAKKPPRPEKFWVETDFEHHKHGPRAVNHV